MKVGELKDHKYILYYMSFRLNSLKGLIWGII